MIWLIVVFAMLIAVFLLFFFMSSSSNAQAKKYENIAEVVDWNAIADEELQSYLPKRKINAIKRYRDLTGAGLKEAKDAVEYVIANPEAHKKSHVVSKAVDTDGAGVRDLIAAGQVDEAIDVYASFMGIDVFSARDAVQEMQREMSLEDGTSESDSSKDYFELSADDSSFEAIDD